MKTKIFPVLTALTLAAVLCGCDRSSGKTESDTTIPAVTNDTEKGSALQVTVSHSYAAAQCRTELYTAEILPMAQGAALVSSDISGICSLEIYDAAEMDFLPAVRYEKTSCPIGVTETDSGYLVLVRETHGTGMETTWRYAAETYDRTWNLQERTDITEEIGADICLVSLYADGNGGYAALQKHEKTSVLFFDDAFSLRGSCESKYWIETMLVGGDGNVYVTYQLSNSFTAFGQAVMGGEISRVTMEGMPEYVDRIAFSGGGAYDFYVQDASSLYGVNMEAGQCEKVVDWTSSDMTGVASGAALTDGSFVVTASESDMVHEGVWHLTARTQEELEQMQVITLASLGPYLELEHAVSAFNRQSKDVRIALVDYSQYAEEGEGEPIAQFEQDILAGETADIICTANLDFEKYAGKGIFADVLPFLEADADFDENAYFMNFFESMKRDGQLLEFSPSFYISTAAAKTEYVGEQQGLNLTEYLALSESLPQGMSLFDSQTTRDNPLRHAVMTGGFISDGACSFDSPEFIELLEFCSGLPGKFDLYDMDSSDDIREDTALLAQIQLIDAYLYHYVKAGMFGGAEMTLVGMPVTGDGMGACFDPALTLAMSAQSGYQEEIWEFFSFMLSEAYQETLSFSLPVNRNAMQYRMACAMQPTVPEGEVDYLHSYRLGEETIFIGEATQEEMDALYAYIEQVDCCSYNDQHVMDIVREEADMYFAGDQTAAKAAERIQSRVSLYLSEQS